LKPPGVIAGLIFTSAANARNHGPASAGIFEASGRAATRRIHGKD